MMINNINNIVEVVPCSELELKYNNDVVKCMKVYESVHYFY